MSLGEARLISRDQPRSGWINRHGKLIIAVSGQLRYRPDRPESGVWLGYPVADPVIGLLITAAILWLVWQSGALVVIRALDGVDPEIIAELRHAAGHIPGVQGVTELQARCVGHHLRAEMSITVAPALSVAEGHAIAKEVRHQVLHHGRFLSGVILHVDPVDEAGERYHYIAEHIHDGLPAHAHAAPEAVPT